MVFFFYSTMSWKWKIDNDLTESDAFQYFVQWDVIQDCAYFKNCAAPQNWEAYVRV